MRRDVEMEMVAGAREGPPHSYRSFEPSVRGGLRSKAPGGVTGWPVPVNAVGTLIDGWLRPPAATAAEKDTTEPKGVPNSWAGAPAGESSSQACMTRTRVRLLIRLSTATSM